METSSNSKNDIRCDMLSYWANIASKGFTDNQNSPELNEAEATEIFSLLPSLEEKDILDLGAGTGVYTGRLAVNAKSVVAVDFIQKFLDENVRLNSERQNVQFVKEDITKTDFPENSFDLVFANSVFTYLDDEEIRCVLSKSLKWLRENGFLFLYELCPPNTDASSSSQPPIYRSPQAYSALLQSVYLPNDQDAGYGFEIILSRCLKSQIKVNKDRNYYCWLLHKSSRARSAGNRTFKEFLDSQQYSKKSILKYERIFGDNFISTGGYWTTKEFVSLLDLKPDQTVLDVGCGIGGSVFFMAQNYGVDVTAIDLSSNMLDIAMERACNHPELSFRVHFEIADVTKRNFQSNSFDVIYSRDTILHIANKKDLFTSFLKWLKPGGKLLITDYCCSEGQHSKEFQDYVKQRGYHLITAGQYGELLEDVGFMEVKAEDRTDLFVKSLKRELHDFQTKKAAFIQEFSEEDYSGIVKGWTDKLRRCEQGDQCWGLMYAEKPK